jgi:hypothetical protein
MGQHTIMYFRYYICLEGRQVSQESRQGGNWKLAVLLPIT